MASSKELLSQIQQYNMGGAPVAIESAIKDAYSAPVKALIQEGNTLRGEAYPAFFNAFDTMGTGAADMSPSASLGAAIGQGERAMSKYRTNLGLRDYYGTMINDLSGKAMQGYQMGYNQLKDLYNIQNARERAARAAAARARSRVIFNPDLVEDTEDLTNRGGTPARHWTPGEKHMTMKPISSTPPFQQHQTLKPQNPFSPHQSFIK